MKQLFTQLNRKFMRPALLIVAVLALSLQSVGTALAAPSVVQSSYLAVSTKAELSRRTTTMSADKKLIKDAGTTDASSEMIAMVDSVQATINARQQTLNNATTSAQVTTVANDVDSDYAEFRAVDLSVKLYADLKTQDKSIDQLRNLAKQIQDTVNAAKANGATHVNAGVAGFVLLDLVNQNLDKLKKSLTAGSITTVALAAAISLITSDDVAASASASALTQLYDQLSATQDTLSNVALGLSQLANIVTGSKTGISYCGFWSNCQGNTNNGVIQVCGALSNCQNNTNNGGTQACAVLLSNCTDNTNNGDLQHCGSLSNCQNNTNDGSAQNCGLLSNCQDNTNNGLSQTCGLLSNCQDNTNNGLFVNCGALSVCAGNTNNGLKQDCGLLSNCKDNTNNGLSQTCGLLSNCTNMTNNGISQDCGALSNCADNTNNGVAVSCGLLSDCSKSINNSGVIQCGALSNCSGTTNNGLLLVCGLLSNCSGATTGGFVSVCGGVPGCSSPVPDNYIMICGAASNCSTTVKQCVETKTTKASMQLDLPFGLQTAAV